MFKRKRRVGRPSNKEIRREKRLKLLTVLGLFFALAFSVYSLSGYLKENVDNLKGQVKYTRNGDYCSEKNIKTGKLLIGDSRTCQMYNYNNSYASFNATWGGHYGYGGETYQIDTANKRAKMKYYAQATIKKNGYVTIYIFATVNDYNGGGNYNAALQNQISLAKTAYKWTQKYKGKTVRPKVYVVSLVGAKGVNVDAYNKALENYAAKTSKYDYIKINDLVGNDGYQSDGLHYTDATIKKILDRLSSYGPAKFEEEEGTFEMIQNNPTETLDTLDQTFTEITYKITYDANGGTNAPTAQTFKYNNGDKVSTQVPTRTGYKFVNWKDEKTNKVFYSGEALTSNYGDLYLVAQWKANTYTVMYGANGGINAPDTQKFEFDSEAKLSYQKPYKDGYTFVNWKHSTSNRTFNPGDTIPKGWGSFILIAQWKENDKQTVTYKITFNANGGTNAPATQTYAANGDDRLTKQVPTKAGYEFIGWKHSASARVLKPGDKIPTEWENFTLIAQWKIIDNVQRYKVTYNANGGKFSLSSEQFVYNGGSKISTAKPTKAGYTFINWKHNTSNKVFNPGDAIPTDWKDFTLIAQYRINTVTVYLDSAGGKLNIKKDKNWGLNGTTITHGGKAKTHKLNYGETLGKYGLTDPDSKSELNLTKSGYKIVKNKEWICASGCTTKNKVFDENTAYKASDFCDVSKSDCSVTLKVNWQKK